MTAFLLPALMLSHFPEGSATWIGPDSFGYWLSDSGEDGGPTFDFIDIAPTGALAGLVCDDCVSAALPLGFTFSFYGNPYSSVYVSSNGFLTFDSGTGSGCCAGQPIPAAGVPNNIIAGYWTDLNPASGGAIQYETRGPAGAQVFIVQFTAVPFSLPIAPPVTLQFQLFEGSNVVEVHYLHASSAGDPGPVVREGNTAIGITERSASAGIENALGNVGLSYAFNNVDLAATAVRYEPVSTHVPSAPRHARAGLTEDVVVVEWDAPSVDGGAAVVDYTVYRASPPSSILPIGVVEADERFYVDLTPCTPAAACLYTVSARNSAGVGPTSSSAVPTDGASGASRLKFAVGQLEPVYMFRDPCSRVRVAEISTGRIHGDGPRDALGSPDTHWQLESTSPDQGLGTTVYSVQPVSAWVTLPDANWINPGGQGTGINSVQAGGVTFRYARTFYLDAVEYKAFLVSFRYAADNNVVFVHQPPSGGPFAFKASPTDAFRSANGAPHVVAYMGPLLEQTGWHTIYADVYNSGGYSGLLLEGDVTATTSKFVQNLNTGVKWSGQPLAAGLKDYKWYLKSYPGNSNGGPAFSLGVKPMGNGWATSPGPVSSWINPFGDLTVGNTTGNAGSYDYRVPFFVPMGATNVVLDVGYAADNGVEFFVNNGLAIGGEPPPDGHQIWNAGLTSAYTGPFKSGWNTFKAVVRNTNPDTGSSHTGLNVAGNVTGDCAVILT